jgi:hypothetical protein
MAFASLETAGRVVLAFAHAVTSGQFDDARALLSTTLRAQYSVEQLELAYKAMLENGDGVETAVEMIQADDMQGWAIRKDGDLGWAYVAICGEDFNEAVSGVVSTEFDRPVLRTLEWGRP